MRFQSTSLPLPYIQSTPRDSLSQGRHRYPGSSTRKTHRPPELGHPFEAPSIDSNLESNKHILQNVYPSSHSNGAPSSSSRTNPNLSTYRLIVTQNPINITLILHTSNTPPNHPRPFTSRSTAPIPSNARSTRFTSITSIRPSIVLRSDGW